ncbi:MAG: hypothetical protein IPK28_15095 [Devosia sp.]|nr:hypothetical protein [Devosia sp.]
MLGTIISYPDALAAIGSTLNPDWFGDPGCRAFAEAALRLHREGHRVSAATLIAAVSPAVERDGLTRAQFLARVVSMAMPLSMLSGPLSTLENRWARRIVAREAEQLAADAVAIDADPHEAVAASLAAFDEVTQAKGERAAASISECTNALLERIATGVAARARQRGLEALTLN